MGFLLVVSIAGFGLAGLLVILGMVMAARWQRQYQRYVDDAKEQSKMYAEAAKRWEDYNGVE